MKNKICFVLRRKSILNETDLVQTEMIMRSQIKSDKRKGVTFKKYRIL